MLDLEKLEEEFEAATIDKCDLFMSAKRYESPTEGVRCKRM